MKIPLREVSLYIFIKSAVSKKAEENEQKKLEYVLYLYTSYYIMYIVGSVIGSYIIIYTID